MESLWHLPMIWMVSVSTLARISSMTIPVCIYIALTYYGLKPTWGTVILSETCRDLVISALFTEEHMLLWYMSVIGMQKTVMCCQRCAIRLQIFHRACKWVTCFSMYDQFDLDSVILGGKQETEQVRSDAGLGVGKVFRVWIPTWLRIVCIVIENGCRLCLWPIGSTTE